MAKIKKKTKVSEGIGVNGFIVVITAIATIITSVVIAFLNPNKSDGSISMLYTIVDRGFYVSLSALIVEVLFNVFKTHQTTQEISQSIHKKDCIVFPKENSKLEASLEEALNNTKVRKAYIVCYGTSKFARILESLGRTDYNHIKTEVIVFSPDVTILGFNKDKEKLRNCIASIASSNNITVYTCNIFPTIRGSIFASQGNNPLFCMMQPYYLNPDPKSSVLTMGKGVSLAIVAQDETSPILWELSSCFMSEFERLKKHSTIYKNK